MTAPDGVGPGRPLKVLQVLGSFGMGGAEVMAITAAETLQGACDTDFLVFGHAEGPLRGRAEALGSTIHLLPEPSAIGARAFIRRLAVLLRAESYDVVHSHVNLASGMVMLAAARAGVGVRVAHSHTAHFAGETLRRLPYRFLSRTLVRRCSTQLVACGQEAGVNLFGKNWAAHGGVVLPNAIKVDRFLDAKAHRERVRAEWRVPDGWTVLGVIGRLMPVKNHQFLLELMRLEEESGAKVLLLVVGDGPLRQELEQTVEDWRLQDRVRFLGIKTDIPAVMGGLDLLVMPSHYEGLPVTLVEAQAAGLPALISDRITRECDLGLGLLRWLEIESAAAWRDAVAESRPAAVDRSAVLEALRSAGYDTEVAGARLLQIYQVR